MALPAKVATVRYAESSYWEARYQREPALFEWFFGHTALRRMIRTYISKKKPVLHIGCGTSNLQEGMARSGYNIVNTDVSEVVIKQMQQRHGQYTNMTYRVSDCRCMPEFLDCSFGHVLDKGTMDALLCCKQGTENVMHMLVEIYRVLQPGGSFLLVTLGDPTRRLPLLCDPRLPWKVSLLLLPKISAANQAYVDGKPINDSTEPVEALGPFEVVDADNIMDLPPGVQYSNFFFAYVCKKQPLQLPQHQGQKGQLPNGWVAGSKELFQKLQKEMGLPEDLLNKGRRKRIMHVPVSQAAMHGLGFAGNSSNASLTSGNSSPVSLAALHSTYSSSSVPAAAAAAPPGDLQSALSALQLEQQLNGGGSQRDTPTPGPMGAAGGVGTLSSECSGVALREGPTRPQSAPDLVAVLEAEAAAEAAAAAAVGAPEEAAAGAASSAGAQLAVQQHGLAGQPAFTSPAAAAGGGASAGTGSISPVAMPATSSASGPLDCGAVSAALLAAPAMQTSPPAAAAAAANGGSSLITPALSPRVADLLSPRPGGGGVSSSSSTSPAGGHALLHSISGPAWLASRTEPDGAEAQQQTPAPAQAQGPSAVQVFNFGARAVQCTPMQDPRASPAGDGAAAAAADAAEAGGALDPSPLPPMGKANKAAVASTPTSPADSPSHTSSGGQPPPLWPGLKLQTGQVLPQLQGQQAMAVSAATAAATAAGMYPHPMAPRGCRAPRLRRFSTEYGALSGSALQVQLEQLRLIQAQHSESAADGLVLHDVAAGDTCGSGAAAAAAVAAAAWGSVRRPRDRRLSNISILSGLSIMSSTSIDESGEEPGSAACTHICSSEPSCQLWSPAAAAADGSASAAAAAAAGQHQEVGQGLSPSKGALKPVDGSEPAAA